MGPELTWIIVSPSHIDADEHDYTHMHPSPSLSLSHTHTHTHTYTHPYTRTHTHTYTHTHIHTDTQHIIPNESHTLSSQLCYKVDYSRGIDYNFTAFWK